VVVEWGAGLLDGITEEWLELDIARPKDSETRTVTFTGHGSRFEDLGWLGAARN
jgi:tRNA threonylcarbamoyladenosine biosynthesis protein TsaE